MLGKLSYGLGLTAVRRLTFEFAKVNGIYHPFNKNRNIPGRDLAQNFMKRQCDLSIPQATSMARAVGFSKEGVWRFFELLGQLMEEHRFTADRISSSDESGISTAQKHRKVVAEREIKQRGRVTSLERGRNITQHNITCVSALGASYHRFCLSSCKNEPTIAKRFSSSNCSFFQSWVDGCEFVFKFYLTSDQVQIRNQGKTHTPHFRWSRQP
jgi:hypothetical protein